MAGPMLIGVFKREDKREDASNEVLSCTIPPHRVMILSILDIGEAAYKTPRNRLQILFWEIILLRSYSELIKLQHFSQNNISYNVKRNSKKSKRFTNLVSSTLFYSIYNRTSGLCKKVALFNYISH